MPSRPRLFLLPLYLYLILSGAAIVYAWYQGAYDPAHSEFAGLPLIILGLPWSFVWHDFNPRLIESRYNNSIIVSSFFIVLNAGVILLIGMAVSIAPVPPPHLRNNDWESHSVKA